MKFHKTRKKHGGLDIVGDIKEGIETIVHPNKALKIYIDNKIHERIEKEEDRLAETLGPEAAKKMRNKFEKKYYDNKEKLDKGIDKVFNRFKSQGRITADYARVALVDAIPIPEVPEVVNDIIDVIEEVGMTAETGISEVELANNIREAYSMAGPGLLSSITSQMKGMEDMAMSAANKAKSAVGDAETAATSAVGDAQAAATSAVGDAQTAATSAVDDAQTATTSATDKAKSATKKPVAKKPVAKKSVAKKPVAKKPVVKKTVAKKPTVKGTKRKKGGRRNRKRITKKHKIVRQKTRRRRRGR